MLKTIKTTKELRLDELIKYVWENHEKIFEHTSLRTFESNNNATVLFTNTGHFETTHTHYPSDIFTVEIEEEITEDTKFEFLVEVYKNGKESFATGYYNYELKDVIDYDTELIYALVNGELELIYKRKEESINA